MSARRVIDKTTAVTGFPRVVSMAHSPVMMAAVLVTASALAMAQGRRAAEAEPGFFESIGRWFEEQGDKFSRRSRMPARRSRTSATRPPLPPRRRWTGPGTRPARSPRLLTARVVDGHQKCKNAPNGAPDRVTAATAMCKAKDLKPVSADMTTAECVRRSIYLTGRNSGPG